MDSIPTTIKNRKLVKEKREQIILAAIKQFPEKGFIKTTLRDLAEAAGISHANIYDYVGNKEDIFVLVHDFITSLADQRLNESIHGIRDPLEKLRRMIRAEFDLSFEWADAILFVYQDIHILKKVLLKELLKKESNHVNQFKNVLDELIYAGYVTHCNTRIMANLIKIMIDSWVIKRWDLKGIDRSEMENSILNLIFDGLLNEKSMSTLRPVKGSMEGKSILIVNGGTPIGTALCSYFWSKGANICVYSNEKHIETFEKFISFNNNLQKPTFYTGNKNGPITPSVFNEIVKNVGPIDIFIQDLGVSDLGVGVKKCNADLKIDQNFRSAKDLTNVLQKEMIERRSGRIVYLAPWAWYAHKNPLLYEIAKSNSIAMTRTLAKKLKTYDINVNCIIPGYIAIWGTSANENDEIKKMISHISENRKLGELQDIVDATNFLVSDSSKYLTGQILTVDGGISPDIPMT